MALVVEKKVPTFTVVGDLAAVFILLLPGYLPRYVIKPMMLGFFCDDDSILYPYHDNTISATALYTVGVGFVLAVITAVELIENYKCTEVHKKSESSIRYHFLRDIPPVLANLYKYFGVFVYGALVTRMFTNVAKMLGRLRPNFLAICDPDPLSYNCTGGYIEEFVCRGDPDKVIDARLSFFSGHASFSWFAAVYIAMYINHRVQCSEHIPKLLLSLIQLLALGLALFTAGSRVCDFKHHWTDVIAGCVAGSMCAIIIGVHNAGFYSSPQNKVSSEPSPTPRKRVSSQHSPTSRMRMGREAEV